MLKSETKRIVFGGIAISTLICGAFFTRSFAEPKTPTTIGRIPVQQTLVRVNISGNTYPLQGHNLDLSAKELDGMALPALQKAGWRIVSVHMTAAADTVHPQQGGLVLLEK